MCEPTTATLMYLTIASTAATLYGQQQQANAQGESNKRQYDNTVKAMAANVNQTNAEHMQERESSMQKLEQNNLAARAGEATALTSAGENGISGMSVDAMLADLSGKSNRYTSSVATNYQRSEDALNNQRENIYSNAASTINGLKTPAQPDYLGAGLRIGTAVYDYNNPKLRTVRE